MWEDVSGRGRLSREMMWQDDVVVDLDICGILAKIKKDRLGEIIVFFLFFDQILCPFLHIQLSLFLINVFKLL